MAARGDIQKYDGSYASVLGVDISYDNIFGSADSAWNRYVQYKPDQRKNRAKTPMLFIVKDMGTDLEDIRDDGFTSHELKRLRTRFQTQSRHGSQTVSIEVCD